MIRAHLDGILGVSIENRRSFFIDFAVDAENAGPIAFGVAGIRARLLIGLRFEKQLLVNLHSQFCWDYHEVARLGLVVMIRAKPNFTGAPFEQSPALKATRQYRLATSR